ncbi:hypothetical protein ACFYV7_35210 [Nocardia suismassiliense]|uniref:Uncharacterized protein n=1 Tax=Nocardia suismassiliense TaxID=2077092 RepID=A0ABW6R3J3_9NOCA
MQNTKLREIVERDGPFASLYIDASHNTEDAAQQRDLRWRAIEEQLTTDGADKATIRLLADAVLATPPVPGRYGRVLIADRTALLADEVLPELPPRDIVRVARLPYVLPLLERAARQVAHVVAVVDRRGSDIYAVDPDGAVVGETDRQPR